MGPKRHQKRVFYEKKELRQNKNLSVIFGKFGAQIGPKLLYNMGAFTQGFVGVSFGFLKYVQDAAPFLGLSYFLR